MQPRIRATAATLLALCLSFAPSLTTAGGPEELEQVVFELTLSGDVIPEDAFALDTNLPCDDTSSCAQLVFCWPVPIPRADSPCEPGTYRIVVEAEAGTTVEYALERRFEESPDKWERLLEDSVIVAEGGITISLGYVYPSATIPLPDTALPAPPR